MIVTFQAVEQNEEDNFFRPILSPSDVDKNIIGDDVANILFEKHPLDKKDFTVVVNISDETSKERSPEELNAFILETVSSKKQGSPEIIPVEMEQQEALDLRVLPNNGQMGGESSSKDEARPDSQIKSNQVCFFLIF